VLSEIRKDYPNILVADAGNFLFRSTRLSSITQVGDMVAAQYVAKGMSLVKYDVANIGPNDLAAGLDFLLTIKKDASFTIISSNVVSTKTNTPIFEASVVKTIGGVKVGFFGIAGTDASGAYDKETFTFADPQETGKKMVAELSKKATVIGCVRFCRGGAGDRPHRHDEPTPANSDPKVKRYGVHGLRR
jgi:2',3'-cyclic-nucleotide 2'-phosphodiesterase (5'-nucleotidase family)